MGFVFPTAVGADLSPISANLINPYRCFQPVGLGFKSPGHRPGYAVKGIAGCRPAL